MAAKSVAAEPGLPLADAGGAAPAPAASAAPAPAESAKADKPAEPAAPAVLDLGGLTVALDSITQRLAAVEAKVPQRDPPPSPVQASLGDRVLRWLREPV